MKNKVLSIFSLTAIVALLLVGCTKSNVELSRESYNWNNIEPIILSFTGPTSVSASGLTPLEYTATFRGGSSFNFTTEKWGATIETPNPDFPNTVMVTWDQASVDTVGLLIVVETTAGGKTSQPDTVKVTLKHFCPLQDGANDLVGDWGGSDAGYTSNVSTVTASSTQLTVSGLSEGVITDWWGETIIDGGTFTMDVDNEGFVDIPRQYIYTTDWHGDPYRYEIIGSGTWENCDPKGLTINYDIYYEGDDVGIGAAYGGVPYFTANLTMGGGKKSLKITKTGSFNLPPVNR